MRIAFAVLIACGGEPRLQAPSYPHATEVAAALEGLDLDTFYDRSFDILLQRSPETLTDLGLSQRDNQLDDISDAFLDETYDIAALILTQLRTYTATDETTFKTYEWYLDDIVRERPYKHHVYSLNVGLTSEHQKLLSLFTQVHPLKTKQNAEDYIERLWRVKKRVQQWSDGLDARAAEGLLPPSGVYGPALRSVQQLTPELASDMPFYTSFVEQLEQSEIRPFDRAVLRDRALAAIEQSALPAFKAFVTHAQSLASKAKKGDGLSALPGGDAAYANAVRHHTTTELTPEQVREYGEREVERIGAELDARFAMLGYPTARKLSAQLDQVVADSGVIPAAECIARYTEILRDAEARLPALIDIPISTAVEVKADAIGGYYIPGSQDGARSAVFYAYIGQGREAFAMKTLAYHEMVPGHHIQISVARELQDVPRFRKVVTFTAHAEGWALYAERLAADAGWYDGDPYGDIGRLQGELWRAARLVVDTGIHARGWSQAQGEEYLESKSGIRGETARYMSWPGQALAYKIGMRGILALRDRQALDLPTFHRTLLQKGSVPIDLLE